ncbi:MAG: phenylalanine--tRNA ligase subunit alpha [Deltaproteobacteria bacterium]|nr:phenylalanine--tRNA ligase subunit alpha [Deltaproteobacteria bacterium]
MKDALKKLEESVLNELTSAKGKEKILEIKTKYLGRKGELALLIRDVSKLPPEERPIIGDLANKIKTNLEQRVELLLSKMFDEEKSAKLMQEGVDVSLPGRHLPLGHYHPITQIMDEIKEIFLEMGFTIAEGPEIETDYYNFEALNIPKDHPARDMQDTFYVSNDLLLRTHTSPVQIRVMEKLKPPLRVIAPGTVYRKDSDITHTPMFHQVEGFMVDEGITFGDLKGVLTVFLHKIFSKDLNLRFRPSFFPFTEPSAEVDIQCVMCKGKGCRVCKMSGWLEILGAGMIHPNVFKAVIRLFFENDVRFLRQF